MYNSYCLCCNVANMSETSRKFVVCLVVATLAISLSSPATARQLQFIPRVEVGIPVVSSSGPAPHTLCAPCRGHVDNRFYPFVGAGVEIKLSQRFSFETEAIFRLLEYESQVLDPFPSQPRLPHRRPLKDLEYRRQRLGLSDSF